MNATADRTTPLVPPAWLKDLREKLLGQFRTASNPAPTQEAWRRTDFKSWNLGLPMGELDNHPPPFSRLDAKPASQGVLLTSLEHAAREHAELVRPHLEEFWAGEDYRKLELANGAFWRGGCFLYVPRGVRVLLPIRLIEQELNSGFRFSRHLILAAPESELILMEDQQGRISETANSSFVSAAFSKLVIGEGAKVHFFYTQSLGPSSTHFWHQKCLLAKDSQLFHTSIALGSKLHKLNLEVELGGAGARSELLGILLGQENQYFDFHTHQLHRGSHTHSNLLFKSVLMDRARSIYTGLIRVEKEATQSNAYQANHNLTLSSQARADSTPILEILTNAVHCKHGATTGTLNPEELFYLETRGLPEEEAKRLLVLGFFEPILKQLPLESLRESLSAMVEERI